MKALEDYLRGSADTVAGIRKTMTAKLSLWYNPRIDAATAANDFDVRELRHSLHAMYVGVTPDKIQRLRPLLALFFQQLVDLTVRTLPPVRPEGEAPGARPARRVAAPAEPATASKEAGTRPEPEPARQAAAQAEPLTEENAPADGVMQPHQADALLSSISGTDIDLSAYALEDGKAAVAAITASLPTVVSRSRRRLAAE